MHKVKDRMLHNNTDKLSLLVQSKIYYTVLYISLLFQKEQIEENNCTTIT